MEEDYITPFGFVLEALIYDLCGLSFYRSLFRCLPGKTYAVSMMMLSLMLICSTAFFLITFWRELDSGIAVCSTLLPFGTYFVTTYAGIFNIRILIIFALVAVLSAVMLIKLWLKGFPKAGKRERAVRMRVLNSLKLTAYAFSIGSALLIVPLSLKAVFGGIISSSVKPEMKCPAADIYDENIVSLMPDQESWSNLTLKERTDVLQVVANCEAEKLSLSKEIRVVIGNMKDEAALAAYDDSIHTAVISIDVLETLEYPEAVEILLHECHHAFQHDQISAYLSTDDSYKGLAIFEKARIYAQEIACYQDPDKNFEFYKEQQCEIDAREYAMNEVSRYVNNQEDNKKMEEPF